MAKFPTTLCVRIEDEEGEEEGYFISGPVDDIVGECKDGETIAIYTLKETRKVRVTTNLE